MYILICDDEPAVARQVEQLARQHLEQRGIPVPERRLHPGVRRCCRTGPGPVQLALLDVDLETMTGLHWGGGSSSRTRSLVLVYPFQPIWSLL